MNLTEARELAVKTMREHGLDGWRFEFDAAKVRFGCCHYRERKITLSRELVALNNPLKVYNTILHEIAHALAGSHAGHGREWRALAKSIGCDGERGYSGHEVATPSKQFRGECPSCGRVVRRHKRNKIACGQCCRRYNHNRFDAKYLFNWTREQ